MQTGRSRLATFAAPLPVAVLLGGILTSPAQAQTYEPPRLQIEIPGLDLSKYQVSQGSQTGYINIPYLAAYISGIYVYVLSIAGVVAGIMIVIGGFQYLTAGGDAGRLKAAKERITNAIAGLLLAFGAYTLLQTVSLPLVQLKGLEIPVVKGIPTATKDEITEFSDVGPPGEAFCNSVESCRQKCESGENPPAGTTADPLIVIPDAVGLRGGGRKATKTVVDGLIKAGAIADSTTPGYVIEVRGGWRSSQSQYDTICRMIRAGDTATLGSSVAWPGASNHQQGLAVDLALVKKTGEVVVGAQNCKSQAAGTLATPEMSKLFDRIMSDSGAARYKNEIWHFDFGAAASKPCRCRAPSCPEPPITCKGNC